MHTIRLRAAWRRDGASRTRVFHKPTGLEDSSRVWLALDAETAVAATLNGEAIAFNGAGRSDVTERLSTTNKLAVQTDDETLLATVRLEIESA